MLTSLARSKSVQSSPEGEELSRLVGAVGGDDLGEKIPLGLLRQFAAVGSLDDCAATVARLLEAGADRVVLVPNPAGYRSTAEMIEQMAVAQALLE
jgi:alkanesulfonate monooxygenase SsuD/methylene tetrahydromethanopterin reductase-like flavin-dependent oxidoreductase (luciferase family)